MMQKYPDADRSQWFGHRFAGSRMVPNVVVIHTTEGTGWPSYENGATAPNLTLMPRPAQRELAIRQHFDLDRSARALRNAAGGVDTNTLNVVQLELIGTCSPATHADWRRRGIDHIYWPDAPAWALEALGDVLAELHRGIPTIPLHSSVSWRPYPASFGLDAPQRMSFDQWRRFRGVCGHQHVPENSHGDPGDLPIGAVMAAALDLNEGSTAMPQNRVTAARKLLEQAARSSGPLRRSAILAGLAILPKR